MEPRNDELGLRERKKLEMRLLLRDVAIRLFAERGFDAVTVADIAAAASVSEKTVFNYFGTKEDLVVSGRAEAEESIVRAVRERPPGQSVLAAVRAQLLALAERVHSIPAERRALWRKVIKGSPSVLLRMHQMTFQQEQVLAAVLREESGADEDDPTTSAIAGTIGVLQRLAFCGITGWPNGKKQSLAEITANIHRTFDLFEQGLADYGVREPARKPEERSERRHR